MDPKEVVTVGERRNRKPESKLAKRFADLVQKGETPARAAALLHVNLNDPKEYGIRAEVEGLLRGYAMKAEVAKELVRASRNKILIESMGLSGGTPDYGLALDAAKQIAGDPDVGLNAPPAPLVQLTFNTIEDLLEQMNEKDVIIDVTPEVPDGEKEEE